MKQFICSFFAVLCLLLLCSSTPNNTTQVQLPIYKELLKKAYAGDCGAQIQIGLCYFWEAGCVNENNTEAFKWFRRASLKKYPIADYWLSCCYERGYGAPVNLEKAETLFNKSLPLIYDLANKGDHEAEFHVGIFKERGVRCMENLDSALIWYGRAAATGHLEAISSIAECYEKKFGKWNIKSFEWYKKAADLGHVESMYFVAEYYANGGVVEQSDSLANIYYRKSADLGYWFAQSRLGEAYEYGRGVEKNLDKAISLYKKAAEHEVLEALNSLACFYRDGYGVNRNYNLAIKYFKLASKQSDKSKRSLDYLQKLGYANFQKLPKRCATDIYDLKPDDAFSTYDLMGGNWYDLDEETKMAYRQFFKREKIREWGEDRATKVAQHTVEMGFTMEQLRLSQGIHYTVNTVYTPTAAIDIVTFPHCTYYLAEDEIFAMVWSNGVQVGDKALIRKYSGEYVITNGNQ